MQTRQRHTSGTRREIERIVERDKGTEAKVQQPSLQNPNIPGGQRSISFTLRVEEKTTGKNVAFTRKIIVPDDALTVIDSNTAELTFDSDYVVQCVATTNITLSGTFAIDGITPAIGQKVLVTAQTTAANNGIYIVQSGAWVRAFTLLPMMFIKVLQGTLGANSIWCLISPISAITPGTDSISFRRIDNNFIPSSVQLQSASSFRSAIGLGTIATQNANNVNITGGIINIAAGANSGMSVGNGSGVTIRTAGIGNLQLINSAGTTYFRMVSSERFDAISNTNSNSPYYLELNSLTNIQPFAQFVRNRNAGSSTVIVRERVNTNAALNALDSIADEYYITPTTGTQVINTISHVVTNNSTSTPDSAIQFALTISGVAKRIMRIVDRGIQIWNGSTNAVRLLVSNALAVSYDLILPTTAPQSGQIITHDGTGQQYFENNVYTCIQFVNSNITMQNNYHYVIHQDTPARRELTLPTNANSRVGMYIRVTKYSYTLNTFRIKQNAVQTVYGNGVNTTEGVTGYIDSTNTDASILIVCLDTDQSTYAKWQIVGSHGTFTLF